MATEKIIVAASRNKHKIEEIEAIIRMCDADIRSSVLDNIFMAENYQRLLKRKEEIMRRILGDA